jgi:RHS repeat-associated protein
MIFPMILANAARIPAAEALINVARRKIKPVWGAGESGENRETIRMLAGAARIAPFFLTQLGILSGTISSLWLLGRVFMRPQFTKIFLFMFLILFASSAYAAYDPAQDNFPDFICQAESKGSGNQGFGGKPVSLATGMEVYSPSVDLSIGNVFPIRITRSYNSQTTYDSPVGYGWALNYDKRLYIYSDSSITIRRECGGKKRFTWSGPGYSSSADAGTLIVDDDGYTYTDKYGEIEKYDHLGRIVKVADTKGNYLSFSYVSEIRDSLSGLLLSNILPADPHIVAYDYRLNSIEEIESKGTTTAPTGNRVDFAYYPDSGRLKSITDNLNRVVSYTQSSDGLGNLKTVTGPNGTSTYDYADQNNMHLLTSIDDGLGAYVNTYENGKVKTQTHGTGVIEFDYIVPYEKTKMTTSIKDKNGTLLNTQTRTVEFDSNRMPVKVTDTFGDETTYIRGSNGWLLQEGHTDILTGATITTQYSYDDKGNTISKTEALGTTIEKTTLYSYHPALSSLVTTTVQSVVDSSKYKVTTNTYDDTSGNLISVIETGLLGDGTPYSHTTSYEYYPGGKLKSITSPRGDVTYYEYDPTTGNLQYLTQAYGTSLELKTTYADWDGFGNPQTVTDPNSQITRYTYYSDTGRVWTVQAPGDTGKTYYVYVSGGCSSCGGSNKIDHIVLPEGNIIYYHYDDFGNLEWIKDNSGNSINYAYDSEGNRLTEETKDPGGVLKKTLGYKYDELNRLKRIENPDTSYTEYGYDAYGNRTSLLTPNASKTSGSATTFKYDALGRLTETVQPGNVKTQYGYNSSNNLKIVTDANNLETKYKYDDMGRVYQVISPDTGTTTYYYDATTGNMTGKTDAKNYTTYYTYDILNRVTKIDLTPADTEYSYDRYKDGSICSNGKGRVCEMTDDSGKTKYLYTAKGQVSRETRTITGYDFVTEYSYDQNGNLKTVTYPSGRVVTYSYSNDKITAVASKADSQAANVTIASSIQYRPFGAMTSITYANGLVGSIDYDNQYRLTSLTAGNVLQLNYDDYDYNGNIKHITNVLDAGRNKTYTYDTLDRLSSGTGTWGSISWTFDGVGNRQTEVINGSSSTYYYNAGTNKLASYGTMQGNFIYDSNGNTERASSPGNWEYLYDQNQRLIGVKDYGDLKNIYTYNGNGQRVKKDVGSGQVTIFHYNQAGQIIAESNSSGTATAEYVYLNGQPLAKIEDGNIYYYHNDHLGTPQKMTDASGTVVWAADYKPFGEATITVSTITNNLRFPGQYFDAETSLDYNYYRDYNPVIGRYIEADPIGLDGGINLFAYVQNSPIIKTDPQGLDSAGCDVPEWAKKITEANACYLQCCAVHDKCYRDYSCTCKSWYGNSIGNLNFLGPLTRLHPCVGCNDSAVICFAQCKTKWKPKNSPGKYYCAVHDVWFDDPNSSHMSHSTDK